MKKAKEKDKLTLLESLKNAFYAIKIGFSFSSSIVIHLVCDSILCPDICV